MQRPGSDPERLRHVVDLCAAAREELQQRRLYVASVSGLHDRDSAGVIDRFDGAGERTKRWTLASERKVEPGSRNLDTQAYYEPFDAFLARLR